MSASAVVASPALASPEDVLGFGPRTSAMGATGPAIGEGYEAVYANPALLSLARERSLTLGFAGAHFDLHAGSRLSIDSLRGSLIGATLPIPFGGILKDRIAIGLGFFTPFNLVVRGKILYPETPEFLVADRTQSVAVQAGVGVDIGYGIRIGGGFAALAALTGHVTVATDASGRIGTVVEDSLVASYGPILGASYDITPDYRVGLTYRGPLVGRFNVVIDVKDLGDIVVPLLNISGVAQYDPWQIALEVAKVTGAWRVAAGVTYKHWSSYPGPEEATVRCPEVDPATGMPFTDTCDVLAPVPVDFHDIIVPHAGVERVIDASDGVEMKLRGGIFFEPTPAPAQTGVSNYYDSSRFAFTLGYGLHLAKPLPPLDFDLFGQLHALLPRDHTKDSTVPATNPGAPSLTSSGVIAAGGATIGVRF